jgi:hypothetical protein
MPEIGTRQFSPTNWPIGDCQLDEKCPSACKMEFHADLLIFHLSQIGAERVKKHANMQPQRTHEQIVLDLILRNSNPPPPYPDDSIGTVHPPNLFVT